MSDSASSPDRSTYCFRDFAAKKRHELSSLHLSPDEIRSNRRMLLLTTLCNMDINDNNNVRAFMSIVGVVGDSYDRTIIDNIKFKNTDEINHAIGTGMTFEKSRDLFQFAFMMLVWIGPKHEYRNEAVYFIALMKYSLIALSQYRFLGQSSVSRDITNAVNTMNPSAGIFAAERFFNATHTSFAGDVDGGIFATLARSAGSVLEASIVQF